LIFKIPGKFPATPGKGRIDINIMICYVKVTSNLSIKD
jgi:hypothetical protein